MSGIHTSENCSGGIRLVMSDGAIWFHPNGGQAPEKLGNSTHYLDSQEKCRSRGEDHKSYGWAPKPERDWSIDQRKAYMSAWEK